MITIVLTATLLLQAAGASGLQAKPTRAPAGRVVCSLPVIKRTKFVAPVYPEAAAKAGRSGRVVIELTVTATGRTADVRVMKPVDPELDSAAVEAVRQWEYQPLVVQGKPMPTVMSVTVSFELPGTTRSAKDPAEGSFK